MRTLGYQVRRALQAAFSRPMAFVLTLGSVALAFLVVGTIFLVAQNLARLTQSWGSGAMVAVDLVAEVPPADRARVGQALRDTPGVRAVSLVTPQAAKERLLRNLGSDAKVVADIDPSFLPTSFEVTLSGSRADVARAQSRLASMAGVVPGVEAVRTVETWFHRLERLAAGLRWFGLALGLLVLVVCGYIIAVTLRVGLFSRQGEISVMRLMGATNNFVRTPFLIEGALQGVVGAGLAAGLLFAVYSVVSARAESIFGAAVPASQLGFLPAAHILYGVAIGGLCGLIGSWAATRSRGEHAPG